MTMTEPAAASPAARAGNVIRIDLPDEPVWFEGYLIAESSSRDEGAVPPQPRWTELYLYGRTDYPGSYIVASFGRSLLYHAPGRCNSGEPRRVGDLEDQEYDSLIPHTMAVPGAQRPCNPHDLDDLADDEVIAVEVDFPSVEQCAGAADVAAWARSKGFISKPASKLLRNAARQDPAIAAVTGQPRHLGPG